MKRIVLIAYDYPPNNGGIARLCGDIIANFEKNGFPYLVITTAKNDQSEADDKVVRISDKRGKLELKLIKAIKTHTTQDDILLCDTWQPAATVCLLSGRKPYILAHGAELLPGKTWFRRNIWSHVRKLVISNSQGVVTNSHYTGNLVRNITQKVSVQPIPLPVDTTAFYRLDEEKKSDNKLKLCTLSRIEKFKAHDFVIRTISNLPQEYKDKISLTIGGKGPYLEELKRLVSELSLESVVTFAGFVATEDMVKFYNRHDVFILCTREEPQERNVEGFGLVFLEAQACGLPAIGSRSGGIPDAIKEGEGGWLVTQDNEKELREILIYLLDNPKVISKEGEKAIKRVNDQCLIDDYTHSLRTFLLK